MKKITDKMDELILKIEYNNFIFKLNSILIELEINNET